MTESANSGLPMNADKPGMTVVQRIMMTLAVFFLLLALALLLPANIPGELATDQMTPHAPDACQKCPPTEQLQAAGLLAGDSAWYLTVRFASTPVDDRIGVSFAGIPGVVNFQQSGLNWLGPRTTPAGMPTVQSVSQQNNRVVFAFANQQPLKGFAVATGSGDRIPAAGFVDPSYPAAPHFNATDAVLLVILAATAWFGFKRGLLIELSDLIAILGGIAVGALASRVLSGASLQILSDPRASSAAVSCLLVLATTLLGFFVLPKIMSRFQASMASLGHGLDGTLGGAMGCLRQLAVIAMLLTVGMDLTVFDWASSSVQSSLLGAPLVHAWQAVFSGT